MFKKKKEAAKNDILLGCAALAFMAVLITADRITRFLEERGR